MKQTLVLEGDEIHEYWDLKKRFDDALDEIRKKALSGIIVGFIIASVLYGFIYMLVVL